MDALVTAVCRFHVGFTYHEDGNSSTLRKFVNIRELKQRHFPENLKIHDHGRKNLKSEMFRLIPIV